MITKKELKKVHKELVQDFEKVTKSIEKYPDVRLMQGTLRGKNAAFLVKYEDGVRKRNVAKLDSKETVEAFRRLSLQIKQQMLENNLKVIKTPEIFEDIDAQSIIAKIMAKYPKLPSDMVIEAANWAAGNKYKPSEWAKADYIQSDYLPEKKVHKTTRGLMVRSKSEVAICELLYKYNVEFRYEEKLIVNGYKVFPDYTIRRTSDEKIFYWEHCGMMDNDGYRKATIKKINDYIANEITPWDNLILTYDRDGTIDLEEIESIIKIKFCI